MKIMRKLMAMLTATLLVLGMMGSALAGEVPSDGFRLPEVLERPTEEPEPEATEAPADPEATEDPEADPEATEDPEADPEATEDPESDAPQYDFERNEDGTLKLDESGKPIPIVPEGAEIPNGYLMDDEGQYILDENGNPIVTSTLPAGAQQLQSIADQLDPNRSLEVYISYPGQENGGLLDFNMECTLIAELHGYDNAVYTLQWQESTDGVHWEDIAGETSSRYTFEVTTDNYRDYWRIQVIITDVTTDTSSDE